MSAGRLGRSISQGGLAAALVLAAGAHPAQAADPVPAPEPVAAPFKLSRPGTLSHWAFVARRTRARAEPHAGARTVARLSERTPERTHNLVLALERVERDGRLWVRVRLPVLPNGTTGWVPRSHLGSYRAVRTHLIVNRRRRTARLVRSGRTIFRARVGVGMPQWPTPRGRFYVRSRLRGFGDPVYGPVAFGTSARSAVLTDWPGGGFIGIHGTNEPSLLPGRVSHGCIRVRNGDILRLRRKMPVGTPVTIR